MSQDFSTPDTFGVRLGGLPVALLDGLGSPDLWRQTEAVLGREERLAADEEKLSEVLFGLIGHAPAAKPTLVALRRSIHNRRPLAARYWNDDVRALLPAAVTEQVGAWVELTAGHREALVLLDATVARHRAAQSRLLREAVTVPSFQHGLVLSSPVLYRRLRKWLDRPPETVPDRSLALRLAKYLARVTTKTSPFATFTVSGLGTWGDGTPPEPAGALAVRSVVEINVWVVQQIVRRLSSHPDFAGRLRLRLNPSARQADGRWEFLGPGADEPLRGLAATPSLRACVEVVSEATRARTDVAKELAARAGTDLEAADTYLGKLVEIGLLEAERPFTDQAWDPLAELRTWVEGAGPATAGLGAELALLAGRLEGYPQVTDPAERLSRVEGVEAGLRRIRSLAGPEPMELPAKNSVIENALLLTPLRGPDRRRWAPVLRDLDVVRRCYGLLDPALPGRVALGEAFAERVGQGAAVPFLTFHRAVQEWLREDGELPGLLSIATHGYRGLAAHRLPRIRELAGLRARLCSEALGAQPDARGVVRLDPARLAGLAADWPAWVTPPDSVAFYGQSWEPEDGGGPRFVVNAVNSGHGRGRDRVHRLLAQAGVAAAVDTAPPPRGVIVADTCRNYGSNVGLRVSGLDHEIDYPQGRGERDPAARIPLSDLTVRHDPVRGLLTLWSDRLGAEVRPVHPSLIAELWLPPAIRLVMQAFGATSNLLIPGRRMFGDTSLARVEDMLAEPRIDIGEVTVSRRQWVFPVRAVPVRDKGEDDRRYLLRLAAWLRRHGMPRRCFVRGLDPDSVVGGSVWRVKSRKPLFVDFANLLLLGVFERMLADDSHVLFLQEALPDPADAPDQGADGPRVTEYLIEINGGQDADR